MFSATMQDVARVAGVHVSTVSRVLHGDPVAARISKKTVERIRSAAAELDYQTNVVARALRTKRSGLVGMLIPDIRNLYLANIVRGAEDELTAAGMSLLVASTDDDPDLAMSKADAFLRARVDGLLIGVAYVNDALIPRLAQSGVPLVLFNRARDGVQVSAVLPDDAMGVADILTHLSELGHKRIGHLPGPSNVSTNLSRSHAFDVETARHGIDGITASARRATEEEGRRVGAELLRAEPRPTAIIAGNDRLALGAIDAIRDAGLRCPEDVSVVGFNDMLYSDRFSPSLTTARISQRDMGRQAASLLLDHMRDTELAPETIYFPPTLVPRQSSAQAPQSSALATAQL